MYGEIDCLVGSPRRQQSLVEELGTKTHYPIEASKFL